MAKRVRREHREHLVLSPWSGHIKVTAGAKNATPLLHSEEYFRREVTCYVILRSVKVNVESWNRGLFMHDNIADGGSL